MNQHTEVPKERRPYMAVVLQTLMYLSSLSAQYYLINLTIA